VRCLRAGSRLEYRQGVTRTGPAPTLRVVSLFTGVAGLDKGLEQAGLRVVHMCESWEPARRVLARHYPATPIAPDVADFMPAGDYEVLAAGFPCTDLSHAGGKTGIFGERSGLVTHVFRIASQTRPRWIALENVPNLLSLHKGAGMRYITEQLEILGYQWAYRTVDTRATGLPQRRPRVIILAARDHDPGAVLLSGHASAPQPPDDAPAGFYWTEGRNGLGLVPAAVPTLKGGSTLGLPSAPAVWFPSAPIGRRFVLPTNEDGEALQGLPRGWTAPAVVPGEPDLRWKLIGNAVTVGIGEWLGSCIARLANDAEPGTQHGQCAPPTVPEDLERDRVSTGALDRDRRWPPAGYGSSHGAWASTANPYPFARAPLPLAQVVDPSTARPLSHRATSGFLSRLDESGRAVPAAFYRDLEAHQAVTRPLLPAGKETASWASSPGSRRRMQAQRQRDTSPEVALRRHLRKLGLGYRLQMRPDPSLRARLDIVFPGAKVAVDVRGCFWHSCDLHGTAPRANAERWADKLARNVERDRATVEALASRGWHIVVVWEHDDPAAMAEEIARIVGARRAAGSRPQMATNVAAAFLGVVRHRVTVPVESRQHARQPAAHA